MGYIMQGCSKEKLEKLGFRYDARFSNKEETYYSYRFDVYRYRDEVPLIEAEFMVMLEDSSVEISVFDRKTRSRYASWYCNGQLGFMGENKVVNEINRRIKTKMKKLGIEET